MDYSMEDNAIARQDPFKRIRTTSAKTETTNTTVQSATFVNERARTVSFQTTRQTVTHQQQAAITEINTTHYSPDSNELESMLAELGINRIQSDRSPSNFGRSVGAIVTAPKNLKTSKTVITQSKGQSVTSTFEEHRINFNKGKSNFTSFDEPNDFPYSQRKTTIATPTPTSTTVKAKTTKLDARPFEFASIKSTSRPSSTATTTTTTTPRVPSSISGRSAFFQTPTSSIANNKQIKLFDDPPKKLTSSIQQQKSNGTFPKSVGLAATQRPLFNSHTFDAQPFVSSPINKTFRSTISKPSETAKPALPLRTTSSVPSVVSSNTYALRKTPTTPIAHNLKYGSIDDQPKKSIYSNKSVGSSSKQTKPQLKPGFAYIFNNEKFEDSQLDRVGSDADVKALKETFELFNMSVEVYKDPSVAKIKSVVKTITNRDFKKYSCLVVAILTHGSRNERVQASDKFYSIDDDVLFPIVKNQSLTEKPKILFIQACKGAMEVEDFHRDHPQLSGTPSEILKCYSTFEGFVSYRTEQGTFFIQKLCEELKKRGKTESIEAIMRSVTSSVKLFTGGKQIPTMTVNLTEPFVFGDYM